MKAVAVQLTCKPIIRTQAVFQHCVMSRDEGQGE